MDRDYLDSDLYNFNKENTLNNSNINQTYFIDNDYSLVTYEKLYEIRKDMLFKEDNKSFNELNFFTISSKEDFTNLTSSSNPKMWKANLSFTPLNDHSRRFLKKGDILFCNRIGQFQDLNSALNTRGIYAIGIALKNPELIDIHGDKTDYKNYKIEIGFPCVLQRHLSTRNIQQHPNTIDLTPYNGNRNDALQWIEDKTKAISLLEMLNVENPHIGLFLKKFFNYEVKNINSLPCDLLTTFFGSNPLKNKKSNSKYSLNKIFTGPAGTGKTYHSIQQAVEIIDDSYDTDRKKLKLRYEALVKEGQISFVTFHQSFSYEEFVEGIKVVTDQISNQVKYFIKDGIFKDISKRALKDPDNNYVLIIDEINRGNISRIFGELITLIEESKRLNNDESIEVILPYTNEKFGVPNNLYIIGTMNSSDKSLTALDIALRRRFEFEELLPNTKLLEGIKIGAIDLEALFNTINERIMLLVGKDFSIGHAYFISLLIDENKNIKYLAKIFENRIIPLLQEYFYDDWGMIDTIFGNNKFIEQKTDSDEGKKLISAEHTLVDIWEVSKDNLLIESKYLDVYQK